MKKLLPVIIVIIVVGAGAFYGGMKYAASKTPRGEFSSQNTEQFRNLSPEEQRQRLGEFGANIGNLGSRLRERGGNNFANGEIIAKDGQSITVQLLARPNSTGQNSDEQESGSRLVFFSETTEVTKTAEATSSDLEINKTVLVTGKQNSDGSLTAETIQLSPLMPLVR